MNIVFDHHIFTMQSYGGISRYFVRLAQGLIALREQIDVIAPLHRNHYIKDLPSVNVHGVGLKRFPPKTGRIALFANNFLSQFTMGGLDTDILHQTYYSANSGSSEFKGRVLTVYDMIHEKFPENFAPQDRTSNNKRLSVSRADHVICISNSTKRDLCTVFNVPENKVTVVHLGFEKFPILSNSKEVYCDQARPFLLYVGARGGYKNFEALIRAVGSNTALKTEFDVVAFGGGPFNATEQKLFSELGFRKNAVRQIAGDDYILGSLYAQARAFVYPSIYEGFGLPPLEAMAHGCPVITSNSSSMPEVVGPAGAYFDPLDIDSQADAITKVVFDEQRRKCLIEAGMTQLSFFSWDRCALETQEVYKNVLAGKDLH